MSYPPQILRGRHTVSIRCNNCGAWFIGELTDASFGIVSGTLSRVGSDSCFYIIICSGCWIFGASGLVQVGFLVGKKDITKTLKESKGANDTTKTS